MSRCQKANDWRQWKLQINGFMNFQFHDSITREKSWIASVDKVDNWMKFVLLEFAWSCSTWSHDKPCDCIELKKRSIVGRHVQSYDWFQQVVPLVVIGNMGNTGQDVYRKPQSHRVERLCNRTVVGDFIWKRLSRQRFLRPENAVVGCDCFWSGCTTGRSTASRAMVLNWKKINSKTSRR